MSDFSTCPSGPTLEDKTTSVVGCALASWAIAATGNAVGTDPLTGVLLCPYTPSDFTSCNSDTPLGV